MATITLKYDGRNTIARKTIEYVLSLGLFEKEDKDTYNPEFVKMVLDADKNDKRYRVDPDNVFESLGIK